MNGYCAERDDVLFSVQRVLIKELRTGHSGEDPQPPVVQAPVVHAPVAKPASAASHVKLSAEAEWTDPATGAGSSKALRRDLMLDLSVPSMAASGPVVLSVAVRREGAAPALPSETLDRVLRCVTEAARGRLGSHGRVYRSERHGLTVLLRDYRGAVSNLERETEDAANRELAARGLPHVTVSVQVVAGEARGAPTDTTRERPLPARV